MCTPYISNGSLHYQIQPTTAILTSTQIPSALLLVDPQSCIVCRCHIDTPSQITYTTLPLNSRTEQYKLYPTDRHYISNATCSLRTPTKFVRQIYYAALTQCGSVAEWLGRWTCDQQVASSNPCLSAIECNPRQVLLTHMCLCHQAV